MSSNEGSVPIGGTAPQQRDRSTGPAAPSAAPGAGPSDEQVAGQQRAAGVPQDRKEAAARQKERYGGVKAGSAFFGWLTATGTAVLLTALLAAAGTAVGMTTGTSLDEAAGQVTGEVASGSRTAETIGWTGGIALLVILFASYYCGGYVAGRMARFNGLPQGIAVWLWAVVIAVVVALVAATAGDQYDVLSQLNSFPRIPVSTDDLTTAGVIALLAVAGSALLGAILGGLAGMRFHRNVDKAAFEPYGA